MGGFDHNSGFIWAIVGLGLALPICLFIYVTMRTRFEKKRLERFESEERGG